MYIKNIPYNIHNLIKITVMLMCFINFNISNYEYDKGILYIVLTYYNIKVLYTDDLIYII